MDYLSQYFGISTSPVLMVDVSTKDRVVNINVELSSSSPYTVSVGYTSSTLGFPVTGPTAFVLPAGMQLWGQGGPCGIFVSKSTSLSICS